MPGLKDPKGPRSFTEGLPESGVVHLLGVVT